MQATLLWVIIFIGRVWHWIWSLSLLFSPCCFEENNIFPWEFLQGGSRKRTLSFRKKVDPHYVLLMGNETFYGAVSAGHAPDCMVLRVAAKQLQNSWHWTQLDVTGVAKDQRSIKCIHLSSMVFLNFKPWNCSQILFEMRTALNIKKVFAHEYGFHRKEKKVVFPPSPLLTLR